MKKTFQNDTVNSIRTVYPQSNVVMQNENFLLVQKEPTEKDYFVVPLEAEKNYESFSNHSYRFLNFMHALGSLCKQYNKKLKENNIAGSFVAAANSYDARIKGYAAQLYFQEDEENPKKPFEKFLMAQSGVGRD